jgi:hypothetical protein
MNRYEQQSSLYNLGTLPFLETCGEASTSRQVPRAREPRQDEGISGPGHNSGQDWAPEGQVSHSGLEKLFRLYQIHTKIWKQENQKALEAMRHSL